ncbi:MAG: hypothetical protein K2O02_05225, partial [Lachnospiraceae bacterium]|nr:hypothetical protein [Lachnospiraceae bacterium]
RVLIEIALIKLTQPAMETNFDSLKNRIANIEKKLEEGIPVQASVPARMTGHSEGREEHPAGVSNPEEPKLQRAVPEEVQKVAERWFDIARKIDGHLGVCLRKNRLSIDENSRLCIVYDSDIDWQQDNKPENIELIKQTIADTIHREIDVELRLLAQGTNFDSSYMSLTEEAINFKIEESDEDDEEEFI